MALLLSLTLVAGIGLGGSRLPNGAWHQDTTETMTVANVTMPVQIRVGENDLVLNGMALRKKFTFKVYVAALYLPQKTSDAEAILQTDGPRYIVMAFKRNVGRDKLCEAWEDGLRNNTPDAGEELKSDFKRLCDAMEDIAAGEEMVFSYLPEAGTTIGVRGTDRGTIAGKDFADALFRCWIGPKPGPGEDFKKHLLGG